jgi:hypothetical protein
MKRLRFSIGGILIAIAILAVALAALRSPSPLAAGVAFSLAFGSLVVAAVNVVVCGWGAGRAYWLGFLLAGGAYFIVCFVPGFRESMCPRLVTEAAFDLLYPMLSPPDPQVSSGSVVAFISNSVGTNGPTVPTTSWVIQAMTGRGVTTLPVPAEVGRWDLWTAPDRSSGVGYPIGTIGLISSEPFRTIAHSTTALLFGVLGVLYARRRYQTWADRDLPPRTEAVSKTP